MRAPFAFQYSTDGPRCLGTIIPMNVIDGEKLTKEVVDPALNRLEGEIIPALDEVLQRNIATLTGSVHGAIDSALAGLGTLLFQADGDVAKLLAGLDGWTLEVEVPKIKITLTGPGQLTPPKAIG